MKTGGDAAVAADANFAITAIKFKIGGLKRSPRSSLVAGSITRKPRISTDRSCSVAEVPCKPWPQRMIALSPQGQPTTDLQTIREHFFDAVIE